MRVTHHKLVRDRIPAIIEADGGQPVTRVLDYASYEAALGAKLLEEAQRTAAPRQGSEFHKASMGRARRRSPKGRVCCPV